MSTLWFVPPAVLRRRILHGSLVLIAMFMTGVPAVASTDQLVKLNSAEASSTIVGYVGQQKTASWLTIKAGLTSYNPKPRITIAKQSKKICAIGSDSVRLAKAGNCFLTLTSGKFSKKLVIGVRQLLPRTTVDRPGGKCTVKWSTGHCNLRPCDRQLG